MVTVEILQNGEWVPASTHTLAVDAEAQKQRFIASGISPDALRIKEN